MSKSFLSIINPFQIISRSYKKGHYHYSGAVVYPGGIKYYPRFPDEKDPEIVPSKLFRVERIRAVKGTPRWHRIILKSFGLLDYGKQVAIVKNTPEQNALLWKIKHMVKITPITFPYGEPTLNDINHTILRENGECIVSKELAVPAERVALHNEFIQDPARIGGKIIQKNSRHKWDHPWSGGF